MECHRSQPTSNYHSDPDAEPIDNIVVGGRLFWIVENIVKTGLLEDMANEPNPITVTSFCDKHAYNADVMERILNILVATKLVTRTNINGTWKYSTSPTSAKYLVKSSPVDRSIVFSAEKNIVETSLTNLSQVLKSGSTHCASELFSEKPMVAKEDENINLQRLKINSNENMNINENKRSASSDIKPNKMDMMSQMSPKVNPQLFIKIMDMMIYSSQHVIPRLFDLSRHRKAVDLGGGSGLIAKLLTDHYVQLSVQVFELPHVANMAMSIHQKQNNNCQRVTFVGGDFFKDDLPPADLYILAHVLHSWTESENQSLLTKIFNSLPPGGELLILEKILNEDKDGPLLGLTMDIMMALVGHGRERSASEYKKLLEDHGFQDTRFRIIGGTNVYDAILTTKP